MEDFNIEAAAEPWAGCGPVAPFFPPGIVRDDIVITEGGVPRTIATSKFLPAEMERSGVWLMDDFELRKELYRGKSSSLFKATCRRSGKTVALKLYRKKKLSVLNRYQVEREIRIHVRLMHESIIRLHAAFEDEKNVYLVQEFAGGGDLFEELKRRKVRPSEAETVALVLAPFLQGLEYLHQQGIIHRDIKPENILLTQQHQLKLADFGLSIDMTAERPVTRAGTLDYMAPEVLVCPDKRRPEDNKDKLALAYNEVVDSWATGILAYEMMVGCPPFEQDTRSATYEAIMYREPRYPGWLGADARSFINMALCKVSAPLKYHTCMDPMLCHHSSMYGASFINTALCKSSMTRPSVSQLLQHPWITSNMYADIPRPMQLPDEPPASESGCTTPTSSMASTDTLGLLSEHLDPCTPSEDAGAPPSPLASPLHPQDARSPSAAPITPRPSLSQGPADGTDLQHAYSSSQEDTVLVHLVHRNTKGTDGKHGRDEPEAHPSKAAGGQGWISGGGAAPEADQGRSGDHGTEPRAVASMGSADGVVCSMTDLPMGHVTEASAVWELAWEPSSPREEGPELSFTPQQQPALAPFEPHTGAGQDRVAMWDASGHGGQDVAPGAGAGGGASKLQGDGEEDCPTGVAEGWHASRDQLAACHPSSGSQSPISRDRHRPPALADHAAHTSHRAASVASIDSAAPATPPQATQGRCCLDSIRSSAPKQPTTHCTAAAPEEHPEGLDSSTMPPDPTAASPATQGLAGDDSPGPNIAIGSTAWYPPGSEPASLAEQQVTPRKARQRKAPKQQQATAERGESAAASPAAADAALGQPVPGGEGEGAVLGVRATAATPSQPRSTQSPRTPPVSSQQRPVKAVPPLMVPPGPDSPSSPATSSHTSQLDSVKTQLHFHDASTPGSVTLPCMHSVSLHEGAEQPLEGTAGSADAPSNWANGCAGAEAAEQRAPAGARSMRGPGTRTSNAAARTTAQGTTGALRPQKSCAPVPANPALDSNDDAQHSTSGTRRGPTATTTAAASPFAAAADVIEADPTTPRDPSPAPSPDPAGPDPSSRPRAATLRAPPLSMQGALSAPLLARPVRTRPRSAKPGHRACSSPELALDMPSQDAPQPRGSSGATTPGSSPAAGPQRISGTGSADMARARPLSGLSPSHSSMRRQRSGIATQDSPSPRPALPTPSPYSIPTLHWQRGSDAPRSPTSPYSKPALVTGTVRKLPGSPLLPSRGCSPIPDKALLGALVGEPHHAKAPGLRHCKSVPHLRPLDKEGEAPAAGPGSRMAERRAGSRPTSASAGPKRGPGVARGGVSTAPASPMAPAPLPRSIHSSTLVAALIGNPGADPGGGTGPPAAWPPPPGSPLHHSRASPGWPEESRAPVLPGGTSLMLSLGSGGGGRSSLPSSPVGTAARGSSAWLQPPGDDQTLAAMPMSPLRARGAGLCSDSPPPITSPQPGSRHASPTFVCPPTQVAPGRSRLLEAVASQGLSRLDAAPVEPYAAAPEVFSLLSLQGPEPLHAPAGLGRALLVTSTRCPSPLLTGDAAHDPEAVPRGSPLCLEGGVEQGSAGPAYYHVTRGAEGEGATGVGWGRKGATMQAGRGADKQQGRSAAGNTRSRSQGQRRSASSNGGVGVGGYPGNRNRSSSSNTPVAVATSVLQSHTSLTPDRSRKVLSSYHQPARADCGGGEAGGVPHDMAALLLPDGAHGSNWSEAMVSFTQQLGAAARPVPGSRNMTGASFTAWGDTGASALGAAAAGQQPVAAAKPKSGRKQRPRDQHVQQG